MDQSSKSFSLIEGPTWTIGERATTPKTTPTVKYGGGTLMAWGLSAVFNPIELVWDELDEKVRAKQAAIAAHLRQLLRENRAELSLIYPQSLVERVYEA